MARLADHKTRICAGVLTALGALASAPVNAATAEELMSQLLLANDLAEACPTVVQRKDGRNAHQLVADGVLMIINDNDVSMADLINIQRNTSPERMHLLKKHELTRRGVDLANRKEVCFFARQIVGSGDDIGRYLEAR